MKKIYNVAAILAMCLFTGCSARKVQEEAAVEIQEITTTVKDSEEKDSGQLYTLTQQESKIEEAAESREISTELPQKNGSADFLESGSSEIAESQNKKESHKPVSNDTQQESNDSSKASTSTENNTLAEQAPLKKDTNITAENNNVEKKQNSPVQNEMESIEQPVITEEQPNPNTEQPVQNDPQSQPVENANQTNNIVVPDNVVHEDNIVLGDGGMWVNGVWVPWGDAGSSGNTEQASETNTQIPQEDVWSYDVYLVPELLTYINNKRVENGVYELIWDSGMEEMVKVRARELADDFSHNSPSGSKATSECITGNGPDVGTIFDCYANSSTHNYTLNVEDDYFNLYCASANCVVYKNGNFYTCYNVVALRHMDF